MAWTKALEQYEEERKSGVYERLVPELLSRVVAATKEQRPILPPPRTPSGKSKGGHKSDGINKGAMLEVQTDRTDGVVKISPASDIPAAAAPPGHGRRNRRNRADNSSGSDKTCSDRGGASAAPAHVPTTSSTTGSWASKISGKIFGQK